jgi:hypothetical protein
VQQLKIELMLSVFDEKIHSMLTTATPQFSILFLFFTFGRSMRSSSPLVYSVRLLHSSTRFVYFTRLLGSSTSLVYFTSLLSSSTPVVYFTRLLRSSTSVLIYSASSLISKKTTRNPPKCDKISEDSCAGKSCRCRVNW